MVDVQVIPDSTLVRFRKKLWHDSELILAKCFNFSIDSETGVIQADLTVTAKRPLYDFIRIAFKNFSESPVEEYRRNTFYQQIEGTYHMINSGVDQVLRTKLPYYEKIYAHQKEGLTFSFYKPFNFFAYEMRLGKSITAASISRIHNLRRTIIICPPNAKWGWYKDLTSQWGFNELYFSMLDAKKAHTFTALQERFVILNYDILDKYMDYLLSDETDHIIIDEAHKLKNHTSKRFKHVKKLVVLNNEMRASSGKDMARISFLSGTPIPNRFDDLYSYFNLIGHELGSSFKKFKDEYTIQTASRGGKKVTGAKNIQDLQLKMSNFMQRKRMDECFDMPLDINSSFIFQMDDYRDEYNAIIEELAAQKEMSAINGNIHSLNIITCKAKMNGMIQAIEDIVAEAGKVVVFGSYTEPLQMLEQYFGDRCVKVDGSVSSFSRSSLRDKFTNDPDVQVFLGNYIAAGEALDLSIASDFFTLNFPLTPKDLSQAKFRLKHPEKRKPIRNHYTFCEASIDEHLYDLVCGKESDINALIDPDKEVVFKENITEVLIKKLLNLPDEESNETALPSPAQSVPQEEDQKRERKADTDKGSVSQNNAAPTIVGGLYDEPEFL